VEASATEVAKRFSRYRQAAQRGPVLITHHGRVTEVLISKHEHDEFLRLKAREPQARWAWELPDELLEAVAESRMDDRHQALDALLDEA